MTQMNLCAKQRLTESRLVVAKEKGVGGIEEEFGVSRCKLLHKEWINNKMLLYPVINHDGKEF